MTSTWPPQVVRWQHPWQVDGWHMLTSYGFSETRAPLSPMIHHHIRYWNCYLKGILNNKAKDHPVDFVSHSIPFKPQYTLLYPMSSLLFSLDPVTIFRHTHISYQLGWLYLHHSTWLVHHILPIGEWNLIPPWNPMNSKSILPIIYNVLNHVKPNDETFQIVP